MKSLLSLMAILLAAPSAQAAEWSDFEEAFPLFPCADGWMACKVDGEAVTPDLRADGSGMPLPANMRIGWYDLKATSAFSPFTTLSEYTGNLPDGVGAAQAEAPEPVDEPAVAEVDNAEAEAARVAAEAAAAARAQAEQEADAAREARKEAAARAAEQKAAAAALAKKAATADAAERTKLEAEAAAAKKAADEAERQRQAAMAEEKKRQEEVQKFKQEEQIRRIQEREVKRQQAAIAKEQVHYYNNYIYEPVDSLISQS